jgi:transposase
MAKPLVPDELWEIIEPLLPAPPSHNKGGRPRVADRNCLAGIIFVLKSGIPWEMLPQEMGCGSGMTCWRRLRDWQAAGVWDRIHQLLLARLREADKIDFSRAVADSSIVRAVGAGEATGPSPVHRGQPGTKHHVLVDAGGVPLVANITGANRHDVTQLLPMVDAIPPIKGKPGRPLSKPKQVQADRAYDSEGHRQELRDRGIKPVLAKRNTEHGSGLGKTRWVVERTISWLHQMRRLRIRYERRADIHQGFVALTMAMICFNLLRS